MSPSKISRRVFLDRIAWVDRMLREIRSLPLSDLAAFNADSRNMWAAEGCLRRALEAIFDLGRHVLARGFGVGVSEYREIAEELASNRVVSRQQAATMKILAGYRNRLVHFYHEVTTEELYQICSSQLGDVIEARDALRGWFEAHPELVDPAL